ncbi:MAG: hypothetical protein QM778_04005 [Myxococcales bacterium]
MDWLKHVGACGLLMGGICLAACSDADAPTSASASAGDGDAEFDGGLSGDDGDGDGDRDNGGAESPPVLPPEVEETLSFDTPQAGRTSVYVPNPVTNRVAVVNAETFAIETVPSGTGPTYAATVPGQDVAVVINVGSKDASLLRTVDGHTTVIPLPLNHDANAVAVSPSGKHAVLYFDASASKGTASSFQDVTVVDLTEGMEHARGVSVGFRPRSVQFSGDGTCAYVNGANDPNVRNTTCAFVNTEDGISVIDLAAAVDGPTIARLVPVGDALSEQLSQDVQVAPDGRYAVARREGTSSMRLVDLVSGEITVLDLKSLQLAPPPKASGDAGPANGADGGLPGVVGNMLSAGALDLSDMDLSPDGSLVLAVERYRGALLRIPLPAGFVDPTQIEISQVRDQLVGQVSIAKSGDVAIMYTTVNDTEGVVLVDLAKGTAPRGVRLRKAVRAVAFSDNGTRALVLHSAVGKAGATASEDDRIDASEGYSLIDTATGFAKLQLTPAAVRQRDILVLDGPGKFFALLRDDAQGVRSMEMADLNSFQVTSLTLARPPSSIGLLPGLSRIFIGQENSGGMITFVDSNTGEVARAVSGFELASRIRQ